MLGDETLQEPLRQKLVRIETSSDEGVIGRRTDRVERLLHRPLILTGFELVGQLAEEDHGEQGENGVEALHCGDARVRDASEQTDYQLTSGDEIGMVEQINRSSLAVCEVQRADEQA